MATSVWLDESECVRDGNLPPVCMRCGDEAHQTVRRTFSWVPSWTIVFLFIGWPVWLVLTIVLTKKMVVYVPLCREHERYFARRKQVSTLLVLCGLGAFFGAIAVGALTQEQNRPNVIGNIGMGVGFGLMAILLIAGAVVSSLGMGASEITDRDIRLKGVHEEFAEALIEQRREERDERDRRPSRRDYEDDDDDDYDDRPRRRRSRDDD